MQLRTTLISTLLLALAVSHTISAEPIPGPRSESEHKFSKRSPKTVVHHHHHDSPSPSYSGGGGGSRGFGGGSTFGTIAAGTALAGGAAFAGTAGIIGAHKLFDSHDDDKEEDGKRGEGNGQGQGQPVQQAPQPQQQYVPVMPGPVISQSQLAGQSVNPAGMQKETSKDAKPIAILMSDGSYQPLPQGGVQGMGQEDTPPQYTAPQGQGQGSGYVFPQAGAA